MTVCHLVPWPLQVWVPAVSVRQHPPSAVTCVCWGRQGAQHLAGAWPRCDGSSAVCGWRQGDRGAGPAECLCPLALSMGPEAWAHPVVQEAVASAVALASPLVRDRRACCFLGRGARWAGPATLVFVCAVCQDSFAEGQQCVQHGLRNMRPPLCVHPVHSCGVACCVPVGLLSIMVLSLLACPSGCDRGPPGVGAAGCHAWCERASVWRPCWPCLVTTAGCRARQCGWAGSCAQTGLWLACGCFPFWAYPLRRAVRACQGRQAAQASLGVAWQQLRACLASWVVGVGGLCWEERVCTAANAAAGLAAAVCTPQRRWPGTKARCCGANGACMGSCGRVAGRFQPPACLAK